MNNNCNGFPGGSSYTVNAVPCPERRFALEIHARIDAPNGPQLRGLRPADGRVFNSETAARDCAFRASIGLPGHPLS